MPEKLSFKKGSRARTSFVIFNFIFMLLTMAVMLFPVLKILSDSLDVSGNYGLSIIPKQVSFAAYKIILSTKALYRPFLVSVYVTVLGTGIGLFLTAIAGYVLIQEDMPGRKLFVYMLLFTMIFSGGLIPTYMTIKSVGLMNSVWAVILPLAINTYNIVLMKNFFQDIPKSLLESAEIDGCTPFGIFLRIVLPMSKPALASIGLFFAVAYWNEFFHFVIYITNTDWYNFQVKLREMILSDNLAPSTGAGVVNKSLQNAAIIVAMVPFMMIYPFLQKYFVKGITLGAVKG
jgi:putative aldouronate transport system permease protein